MFILSLLICLLVSEPKLNAEVNTVSSNFDLPYFATYSNTKMIKVKYQQTSDSEPKINFIEISEDKRCPKGKKCTHSGQVSINVELETARKREPVSFTIPGSGPFADDTHKTRWGIVPLPPSKGNTRQWNGQKIYLVDIAPYPEAGKAPIEKDQYVATFFIQPTLEK